MESKKEQLEDAIYSILEECDVKGFESEWTDKAEASVMIAEFILEREAARSSEMEKSKWVSVDDRLPEYTGEYGGNKISDNVLVWNGEDIYKANLEAVRPDFKTLVWSFSEIHGCGECGYDALDEIKEYSGKPITHWQPLPQPPTTDK